MIRKEFIDKVQEKTPIGNDGRHWSKNDCAIAIDIVIGAIKDIIIEEDFVKIAGFGTFSVQERKARRCVNPRNQEIIMSPAHKVPHLKFSDNLKDMVAGK